MDQKCFFVRTDEIATLLEVVSVRDDSALLFVGDTVLWAKLWIVR